MDDKTMTPLKRIKDSSMMATVLAISLSLLIAAIAYFAIFTDKPAVIPKDSKPINERPISTSTVKDNQLIPPDDSVVAKDSPDISDQSDKPQKPQTVEENSSVKQVADLKVNKTTTRTETIEKSQQNPPEYTVKQTEKYQQLDANIDEDNEQLAGLIDEVKKRNQSQIQQHQLPKADTSINNTTPAPQADSNYPITPITPSLTDNNKTPE